MVDDSVCDIEEGVLGYRPVDGGDDLILSERGMMCSVNAPDGVAPFLDIVTRYVKRVVEGRDDEQEPGEGSKDLVSPDCFDWVRLASCERVHC